MIRDIVHDVIFLGRKSEAATKEDLPVVQDLLDTLKANRRTCVGMAANMIGSLKRIIVVHTDRGDEILINPVIEKKTDPFGRRRLPVPGRHAEDDAVSEDTGLLPGPPLPQTPPDLHRLDSPDHPA